MTKRPDNDYVLDMKKAVERALQFTSGMNRQQFDQNQMCQSAITYQLAILGEAAKQISKEFRASHPHLPWKEVTGLRDILVHAYHGLDMDVLWKIIEGDLPPLLVHLEKLVKA